MADYEYGRAKTLADALSKAGIAPEIRAQILEGAELVRAKDSGEKKAEWVRQAMKRMDDLLDKATRHKVREDCACCLGGKRLEVSKGIAKKNSTLDDRLKAANEARFVFGHSVTLQDDGRILVSFFPEGLPEYGCVCLRKAGAPISITYCYCCGGHVKHHLQHALGRKLEMTVKSSALSSGGTRPCQFLFAIEAEA